MRHAHLLRSEFVTRRHIPFGGDAFSFHEASNELKQPKAVKRHLYHMVLLSLFKVTFPLAKRTLSVRIP